MNQKHTDELESFINLYGLNHVLEATAIICDEKSNYFSASENNYHRSLANDWANVSIQINGAADLAYKVLP